MFRVFLFLLSFTSLCLGAMQDVELLANSVEKDLNLVEAKGDVLVYSKDYIMSANKALYNETNGDLELFGKVNIIRENTQTFKSEYVKLNLRNDSGQFKPFFTYDTNSSIWIECEQATGNNSLYITKNSIASSCNVQNPTWKIGFSKGKLNKKTNFMQLENVVFYIRNIPIFYFPYFTISTNTSRTTGFLIPLIGYSTTDGIYYSQPFYIAESEWWDIEISPQVRTQRGYGMYVTGRFVDTPYSKGKITAGIFDSKNRYKKKQNLKHDIHHGYEIEYENRKLISYLMDIDVDDGLWIDYTYLNDIDYLNLKDDNDKSLDSLVTSRLNYFMTKNDHYLGIYSRYYIDTSKIDNDTTLQEIPTLHYHHFLDDILLPNILYSIDTQYHRYDRDIGISAQQFELNLPVKYYTTFFDDFLHVSASEHIYATNVDYYNIHSKKSDTFTSNYHEFSMYTTVAKPYENFYHTFKTGLDYIVPSWDHGEITEDFISTQTQTEQIRANLIQFFYNKNGQKKIRHTLTQIYNLDDDLYDFGDFEHSLSYYFNDNFYIKNDTHYSFENKRFSKVQTSLSGTYDKYNANIIHTYLREEKDEKDSFISASFDLNYDKHHNFFAKVDYDFEGQYAKGWRLGFSIFDKCLNYSIVYKEDNQPKLTSAGSDFVQKRGFYLAFELYPLGSIRYDFSKDNAK